MARLKVRYLASKRLADGTKAYYWNCRRALALGLQPSVALGTDLSLAMLKAEELNRTFDAVRRPTEVALDPGTLRWLMRKVETTEDYLERPSKTQKEITQAFNFLRGPYSKKCADDHKHRGFADFPINDITGEAVKKLHKTLAAEHSLDVAARTCKWLRWLFNQAKSMKALAGENPMDGMKIKKPPPRQIYWFEEEVTAAIAKAKEMGLPSIGVAIRLAFDTGQREGDVLRMTWTQYDEGEILVKQSKTDAVVRMPALPELVSALAETPRAGVQIVISEGTKRPYKQFHFVHRVAEVIEAAGLKGKTFGDLRRSAVVRLAQSGCTIPEIASITGHSYARCEQILQVYLPRTTPMARAAIQKVLAARVQGEK